ncbi:hypothetical protein [Scytonema sp. UIC 10036]|uniref:hypothetical protein n=1 Tax=Scytonema sp. UIC 10036 TaxID=2304196 RepID=UPI001FAA19FA|nr:hypothetical protein [Scytonema sp. UIC 10036]
MFRFVKYISVVALIVAPSFWQETAFARERPRERTETYCYPVIQTRVSEDPAYHPRAYADGYRQGLASAQKGEAYKPRTALGEFARGFDDGYFGKEFTGQKHSVPNQVYYEKTTECSTRTIRYKHSLNMHRLL